MKVLRDITTAVLVGIMGGFLVTTISYYNHHKEGGAGQTLMAVLNSFHTVTEAYSDEETDTVLSRLSNYDVEEEVLEAFENVENGEVQTVQQALLQSLLVGTDEEGEADILAMDSADGLLEEGAPYSGILRFHVRANSDSEEDQALKIAVKEDVVTFLKPLLSDCENVEESKEIIVAHMQDIYETAIHTIVEQGYDYTVKVYVTEEEFPAKTYGDLTFPEGEYQALRIDIGAAKGQNWWCVMYPPLCFIDASTAVVSEDGKKMLQENLTPEEYADLFANSQLQYESKLLNWIQGK